MGCGYSSGVASLSAGGRLHAKSKQEAQLLQTGRAMLRVMDIHILRHHRGGRGGVASLMTTDDKGEGV